jgi:hypothetical protein
MKIGKIQESKEKKESPLAEEDGYDVDLTEFDIDER